MMTEKKRNVGRPKGSKSPRLKLKPENEKKGVKRQFRFTEAELSEIQEAAQNFGLTVSEFFRRAALEKAGSIVLYEPPENRIVLSPAGFFLKQLQFLRKIMGEGDDMIFQTAISDLYRFRFETYIHQRVEDLRSIGDFIEQRVILKEVLTHLYADQGDIKAVKNNLNYLDVPPHGQSWKMADVRKTFKDLGITAE